MLKTKFRILLIVLSLFSSLYSQTTSSSSYKQSVQPEDENNNSAKSRTANSPSSPARRAYDFFPFDQKLTREQKQLLLPNKEVSDKYYNFLQEPETGLIRLSNDIGCHSNPYILRADDDCRQSIPEGSSFSFRKKKHIQAYLADIRIKDNLLISDNYLSQNIIVKLGDVSLENLSPASEGIKFLRQFVPASESKEAKKQFVEIVKGISVGKYEYRKVIPAVENTTYAMRVIPYRASVYKKYRGLVYNVFDNDKRVDLLVVFRVVKKEDGYITLLWKELEKKKAPKISFSKK